MKSIVKHSIMLAGRRTSITLEEAFWQGLKEIATSRQITVSDLINRINVDRKHNNLPSALRLFVLSHYQGSVNADARRRRNRCCFTLTAVSPQVPPHSVAKDRLAP
jgi:predicted DNA-binding ribbon-helix-helix protein